MSLSVGIVGLPNAGKSTLFNALASRRLAETAPRPFTTIEPHEAVVEVPDKELKKLSDLVKPESTVSASVTFIDIAGLVRGAHKGEGLGNEFLGQIREVDAIVHVVRAFEDPGVTHQHATHEPGSSEQILEDIEIVNIELELGGITGKPVIYVLNVDEKDLNNMEVISKVEEKFKEKALLISAQLEEEFIDLTREEKETYLGEVRPGLDRLILHAYELLGLITFYTIKGGKEVHAWSIKRGAAAIEAAGAVHTDFAKGFIKAEVVNIDELLGLGGWRQAKEEGKVKLEGRDYVVENEDVIEFKIGS
ncbi:MAG: GTP-binding protein [Parcubacteria group bacterium GW2011_GWA1_Parcubacteria_45_10]|nr:MAG: GTP-binding protein [Parcubacteria group bacterium GW2011_GWA1_Parcubacteria_45_10]